MFPRDEGRKKLWIIAIKRLGEDGKKLWQPSNTSLVCGDHFLPDDYIATTYYGEY